MIANHAHFKRNSGSLGVTEGGICSGVGKRHDQVGSYRGFSGELATVLFSGQIDIFAENGAVRTGKIDEFKDAKRFAGRGLRPDAFYAVFADDNDFAGIDFPHEFGLYQVQRTGFRGQYIMTVQFSQTQRPEPVGILNPDNFAVAGQNDK